MAESRTARTAKRPYDEIRSERRGDVALVTLNRPDRLNAWTPHMAEELADALRAANEDPAVGAIVMTGEGRGFCAGADMEATFSVRIGAEDPGENTAGGQGGMPAGVDWVELCRTSKPLVAAVNGADGDAHAVQRRESALLRECWETLEHAEAVAAFMEKRAPSFPPRQH